MNEQVSLFEEENIETRFYKKIRPALMEVMDINTLRHSRLVLKQAKTYSSVLIDKNVVFRFKFANRSCWVQFPLSFAKSLPQEMGEILNAKDGYVKVKVKSEDEAAKYDHVYAAALDHEIDLLPRSISCCSRYMECSKKDICVNPYPRISEDCRYKINLKHGRNFFKTSD